VRHARAAVPMRLRLVSYESRSAGASVDAAVSEGGIAHRRELPISFGRVSLFDCQPAAGNQPNQLEVLHDASYPTYDRRGIMRASSDLTTQRERSSACRRIPMPSFRKLCQPSHYAPTVAADPSSFDPRHCNVRPACAMYAQPRHATRFPSQNPYIINNMKYLSRCARRTGVCLETYASL
jgi:hypothetical protein